MCINLRLDFLNTSLIWQRKRLKYQVNYQTRQTQSDFKMTFTSKTSKRKRIIKNTTTEQDLILFFIQECNNPF